MITIISINTTTNNNGMGTRESTSSGSRVNPV